MSTNLSTPPPFQALSSPSETASTNLDAPLSGIPPLTTYITTSEEEQTKALKLIADSIAQQRQTSSRAAIFHPISIAVYVALVGIIYKFLYTSELGAGLLISTILGLTMALLSAVRYATSPYLSQAESINFAFLDPPDSSVQDTVIVSKFGEEIIGALALRLQPVMSSSKSSRGTSRRKGSNGSNGRGGSGLIRAWTVRLRFRGKGVGTEMLEEAVKISRDRLGRDVEVGFAADHANAKRVLPKLFNGGMEKGERKAAEKLSKVVEEIDARRRR